MTEVSTITARPEFERVVVYDVMAYLAGGGSVVVENWSPDSLQRLSESGRARDCKALLVEVFDDVDGSHCDTVSMHPDEQDRLAVVSRAIEALESARDALRACGQPS